jgi:hypothetical protein
MRYKMMPKCMRMLGSSLPYSYMGIGADQVHSCFVSADQVHSSFVSAALCTEITRVPTSGHFTTVKTREGAGALKFVYTSAMEL